MRGALVQRADVEAIARRIRDVPDFPKPGIVFKDITPLLLDASAFRRAVELMTAPFQESRVTRVVSIESRGFLLEIGRASGRERRLYMCDGITCNRKHTAASKPVMTCDDNRS